MKPAFFSLEWASASSFVYLVPLAALALVALFYRFRWQKKTSLVLDSSHTLLNHFSLKRKAGKTLLLFLSLIFLVLSLGRPQWDESQESIQQEGRNVLIALDVSRSMLAQDLKPSRLMAAKKKIQELVIGLTAERVSLMLFSDVPFIQCPFTTDIPAFLNFLDLVDVESISTGTTALDKALLQAVEIFGRMPQSRNNIMIIFTDGEDFSPRLTGLQEKAQKLGLHIFTVGMATAEGAPIPLYNEQGAQIGHQKDKNGSIVISRLYEELLAELSKQTGATYIPASQDSSDIYELITHVQRFEKEKFETPVLDIKQEKYSFFALISFALLLLDWIL
ncbi:VWA domain-containing protein [Candidatus Dependentiae bacterium]|nr:VWA domain-containing protein [Candidatus Dependentiae bacterium]